MSLNNTDHVDRTLSRHDDHLRADSTGAEYSPGGSPAVQLDALSNGFKHREGNGQVNASGGTYIFIAFAESPFKHTNAR